MFANICEKEYSIFYYTTLLIKYIYWHNIIVFTFDFINYLGSTNLIINLNFEILM